MARCRHCGADSPLISARLGFCGPCLRRHFASLWPEVEKVHFASRRAFHLPLKPPQAEQGRLCTLCFHACRIPEGGMGYCGARRVVNGRLTGGTPAGAGVSWYDDALPTNCVADWFCPGGTGRGYPKYACRNGPEYGKVNLAVFYHACNFNCLYCQNWDYKRRTGAGRQVRAQELAGAVHERTACICYFGGDPTPHLPHALAAARLAREQAQVRICWESNGAMQSGWLKPLVASSLESGGVIKFDLKAFSEELHLALTGVSNKQTLKNFAAVAQHLGERPEVPLLTASTLMVPGYVDLEEIHGLARFLASLNPEIPYSLLAFYPQFYLTDLPVTPRNLALTARQTALQAGVKHVRVGNEHLLRD
ncbi:MAG: radical SAM protein [Deltaproteobacteria bacterium]|nr:radical SAM protein [Deltaproteobacteria bacterium]